MFSIGIITGLIAMLCWGVADFLFSIPTKKLGAKKTIVIYNIFSLILVLPFILYFYDSLHITLTNLVLLIIAILIDAVAIFYFLRAFEIGEVSIVVPISAGYSLVTVILAVLFLSETLTLVGFFSIFIIIIGLIFTSTDIRKLKHIHTTAGVKESLIAMIGWGVYFFIIGNVSKTMDYKNLFVFTTVLLAIVFAIFAIIKRVVVTKQDLKHKGILPILIITSIIYSVAWFVINYGITQDLVSLVTPISSLYPVITVILAVVFYKEKLVLNQKLGILAILAGLFLISM